MSPSGKKREQNSELRFYGNRGTRSIYNPQPDTRHEHGS